MHNYIGRRLSCIGCLVAVRRGAGLRVPPVGPAAAAAAAAAPAVRSAIVAAVVAAAVSES